MDIGKNSKEPTGEPQISFEEAFSRLEKTVQALETGGLTLEEATRLYEEGMVVAKLCSQLLDTAELRITELKNAYAENPSEAPTEDEER